MAWIGALRRKGLVFHFYSVVLTSLIHSRLSRQVLEFESIRDSASIRSFLVVNHGRCGGWAIPGKEARQISSQRRQTRTTLAAHVGEGMGEDAASGQNTKTAGLGHVTFQLLLTRHGTTLRYFVQCRPITFHARPKRLAARRTAVETVAQLTPARRSAVRTTPPATNSSPASFSPRPGFEWRKLVLSEPRVRWQR